MAVRIFSFKCQAFILILNKYPMKRNQLAHLACKIVLAFVLLCGLLPLQAQQALSPSSRTALAEQIATDLGSYIDRGTEELVDDEFSIWNIPSSVWGYVFKSKETRKNELETKLQEYVSVDSITSITNKHITLHNKKNPQDQIRPITLGEMQGVVSDEAVQQVQDRAFLDVADLLSELAFWLIAWVVVWLAVRYLIAPWLAGAINDINGFELLGHVGVDVVSKEGGFLNQMGHALAEAFAKDARERKVQEARQQMKTIRRCVIWPLTIGMIIWQVIESPKREARAKEAIQQSYVEALSQQNIISHVLHQ